MPGETRIVAATPAVVRPPGEAAVARDFLTGRVGSRAARRSRCAPVQGRRAAVALPCRLHDPELWFAERPDDLERAKALCGGCPIRLACLAVAIDRAEDAGVWGGHIFERGRIVPRKRPRGRPRKNDHGLAVVAPVATAHENRMISGIAPRGVPTGPDGLQRAAARLYDAECALHASHQSGVQDRIGAANQRLYDTAVEYLAAAGARPASVRSGESQRRRAAS